MAYSKKTTPRDYVHLNENYLRQELYQLIKKDDKIFDFIQDSVLDGLWFWDLNNPENEWMNKKFWTTLGYDPTEMPHKASAWQDIINQEDLKKALDNFAKHTQDPSYPYDQIVRYTHKLGHTVWIRCKGFAIRDDQGKPIRMIGAHTDVTELKKAEENLQKQVEKYEEILDGGKLGTWEWNLRTGEVIFDEQWAQIMGYSLLELQPISLNTWVNFMHPSDHAKSTKILQSHYEGLTPNYECEVRMKHKNGEWIWVLIKGKITSWDQEGNPEWLVGSHVDITQNKKALEKNRLFVSQAPSAIAMFDRDMKYLAASAKWFEDYNIEGQNIIGKSHYEVFPRIDIKWKANYEECLEGNTLQKDEDFFERDDGTKQWISWELRPWYNTEGRVGGILMHTSDITKLKEAEAVNAERKVFLEAILNTIDVGIVSCDQNGKLTLFNKATKEWHGLPVEPVPPEKLSQYYGLYKSDTVTPLSPEDIPLLRALKGEHVQNEEIVIKPTSGKVRTVVTNGSQLKGLDGEITGAVVAMHDINDRKMAEDKLRISEEAFRGNFENAAIGMAIIDLNGRWVEVNEAVCEMVGYRKEELTNMTFHDITHPEDLKKDLELLKELTAGKIPYYRLEKRYIDKTGKTIYTLLSVSIVKDKNQNPLYYVSQIMDISKRIGVTKNLQRALAKLEGVLGASNNVSIISTDTEGYITTFNTGAENLLGYKKEELIYKEILTVLHLDEEIKEVIKELAESLNEKIEGFDVFSKIADKESHFTREWTYVKKDGTRFPVQLTITPIEEQGTIIGYLGVAADISEIKKAEKELKSILELTEDQNKRLRNFAHIVSHNLKSHAGNFEMLLDIYLKENPAAKESEIIQLFKSASGKLSDTIRHLNEVVLINNSTLGDNLTSIHLKEAMDNVVHTVEGIAIDAEVDIKNSIPEGIFVKGIPAYLDSIILNFITNSIKYRSPERKSFVNLSAKSDEDFVVVVIEDNGIGIDLKKHRNKLFGMYKTFHNNPDSRGIGLFITKNQVEALGGKIEVHSKINEGTTFEIYLKHGEI
ncbi:PAS domain S-box protein [Aquimarina sp. SS2-1]|uniref:PAS domain-containing protein n=1 Tax=Aquimarina besae TaxID=3342247 RepID=UPI00366EC9CC